MKFDKYNAKEHEPLLINHWKNQKITEKIRERNKKGKKFYFLQGPPYTSGRVHLGTAWNTALKDVAIRYKRMNGFNVWDRGGYDMHGLPTAHKVMKKHNLKDKEDIQKYGIKKFINECIKYSNEQADVMNNDFYRIGATLDFENSYKTISKSYVSNEWWFVKKAWEKDRLYKGKKVITWCQDCETALAKHETEYQEVKDNSIFVKFKIKGKENEYLIIWTTTPWTIPFNLAIMVHPELDYVKGDVDGEKWIVGAPLAGPLVQGLMGKEFKLEETFKGEKLKGVEYEHPFFNDISLYKELKDKSPNVHTVVLSEQYVDFSAGSGLVHCAPGCGPEDNEVGKENDILPLNNIDEKGVFPKDMGMLAGLKAKKDDKKFIEIMKEKGVIVAESIVEHDYPHCWRCHKPLVFRMTDQWFLKVEDIRNQILENNKKTTNWIPQTEAFNSWIKNFKDNSVTRQRFWGTPFPVWECDECGEHEVIGGEKELEEKSGKKLNELHIPWVDECTWKCSKCGKGTMKRLPDVLDVWVDSGTASWNCLDYPSKNSEEFFNEWFPADFILEATEQTRLWFSLLEICSNITFGKSSYKNVYMHGMLLGVGGVKMSKSLGNIISPYEIIDKYSADTMRYYTCHIRQGNNMAFDWKEVELKYRNLQVLWNTHRYLLNLCKDNKINPFEIQKELIDNMLDLPEKYILSRSQNAVKEVTQLLNEYKLNEAITPIEELYLDLSRTYIKLVRDKATGGEELDKKAVLYTIANVLMDVIKMFSIYVPFMTEAIYMNMKSEFGLKEESIHHFSWPSLKEEYIDNKLELSTDKILDVIQAGLSAREKTGYGVRWALRMLVVDTDDEDLKKAIVDFNNMIKSQVNVLNVTEGKVDVKVDVKPDIQKIEDVFEDNAKKVLAELANMPSEDLYNSIRKQGKFTVRINDEDFTVPKDMFVVEKEIPSKYNDAEFKLGDVYIDNTMDDELEAMGFSREVVRRAQQTRKNMNLTRSDRVDMFIKVPEDKEKMLEQHADDIKEKAGAKLLNISPNEPAKEHEFSKEYKIKGEQITIYLNKV